MAMIPREMLNEFTAQLNSLSAATREIAKTKLENLSYSSPDDLFVKTLEILNSVCGTSTDKAAAYAASFYDAVRKLELGETFGAEAISNRSQKRTIGTIDKGIEDIKNGKTYNDFMRRMLNQVDYEIKRAAGECVQQNGKRDKRKVRFARVPTGNDTCEFCIMLASRGFDYLSKESAGSINHYHPNCDCRIVPGFEGETQVEGYDPDELYEQYLENKERKEQRKTNTKKDKVLDYVKENEYEEFYTGSAELLQEEANSIESEIARSIRKAKGITIIIILLCLFWISIQVVV